MDSRTAGYLAEGDLTARVEGDYSGELAALKDALNQCLSRLEAAVSDVMQVSQGVQAVAGEIAQGSGALMERTQAQVASIEETAASMEDLSTTVRQKADNARSADRLAGQTRRARRSCGGRYRPWRRCARLRAVSPRSPR